MITGLLLSLLLQVSSPTAHLDHLGRDVIGVRYNSTPVPFAYCVVFELQESDHIARKCDLERPGSKGFTWTMPPKENGEWAVYAMLYSEGGEVFQTNTVKVRW